MIYIIRHGETVWNLAKRKQGNLDSPLTLKGLEQATLCGQRLASEKHLNVKKMKIVVSPQSRAKQHASIICEQLKVSFDDCVFEENLREHSFGLWEGKIEEEIEKEFPCFLERRYKPENYWSYIIPKGESYELLYNRVSSVIEKYGDNTIYICHEMVSKVMRGKLMSMQNDEILQASHPQNVIYKYNNSEIKELII
jgi:probable phosphoglycerate mutase